jgi:hypothetical protein
MSAGERRGGLPSSEAGCGVSAYETRAALKDWDTRIALQWYPQENRRGVRNLVFRPVGIRMRWSWGEIPLKCSGGWHVYVSLTYCKRSLHWRTNSRKPNCVGQRLGPSDRLCPLWGRIEAVRTPAGSFSLPWDNHRRSWARSNVSSYESMPYICRMTRARLDLCA